MILDSEKLIERLNRHPLVKAMEAEERLEQDRKELGRKRLNLIAELKSKKIQAALEMEEVEQEVKRAYEAYKATMGKRGDTMQRHHTERYLIERSINEIAAELRKTAPDHLVEQREAIKKKADAITDGEFEEKWKTRKTKLYGAVDINEQYLDIDAVRKELAELHSRMAHIDGLILCEE